MNLLLSQSSLPQKDLGLNWDGQQIVEGGRPMSELIAIPVVSTALLLVASFYALKMAKFGNARIMWFVIASVPALRVLNRVVYLLSHFIPESKIWTSGLLTESIALFISLLMLMATLLMASVFRSKVETGQELLRRNQALAALNTIAETVSRSLDLDSILNAALDKALEVMDVEAGLIHLLDEEADELIVIAHQGLSDRYVQGVNRLKVGEGLAGQVAQSGEPLVVTDISSDPRLTRMVVKEEQKRAFVSVPLKARGKVQGTMNLVSRTFHQFTPQEIQLLTAIGDQIGLAIENARLFGEMVRAKTDWEETFAALRDGIAIVDKHFTITRVNQSLVQMFGLPSEQMIGRKCYEVFHDRGGPTGSCALERLAAIKEEVIFETIKTSVPNILGISVYPIFDASGELMGAVHNFRDIAEADALRKLTIQDEKLIAVGRLAASIAHEINNPLYCIQNCLDLLPGETDEHESAMLFRLARGELDRVILTLRRMLDFARPTEDVPSPIDINQLLENTLALTQQQLQYAKVQVKKDFDLELPPQIGLGDQLTQVFINMIFNAIEAMSTGGELHVTTRRGDVQKAKKLGLAHATDTVEIAFADTGCGIPPENLERLFEPFFSTKEEVEGVGLGLWISYGIIQKHKGTIEVDSEVGKGTTFTITLPAISKEEWEKWEAEGASSL
jgi:two-component system NtrC family sensor kinase